MYACIYKCMYVIWICIAEINSTEHKRKHDMLWDIWIYMKNIIGDIVQRVTALCVTKEHVKLL